MIKKDKVNITGKEPPQDKKEHASKPQEQAKDKKEVGKIDQILILAPEGQRSSHKTGNEEQVDRSSEDNTGHMGDESIPGKKKTMNLVRQFEKKLMKEQEDKKIVPRTRRKARRRCEEDSLVQTRVSQYFEINGERNLGKNVVGGGSMGDKKNGALLRKRKLEEGEESQDKRGKTI
jgi:hypothetical protein